jgi:hypothetical protein
LGGRATKAAKLLEGDAVGLTGDVTHVHDDGTVAVRVQGYGVPVMTRGEHLSLVAKRKAEPAEAALRQAGLILGVRFSFWEFLPFALLPPSYNNAR